MGRGSYTANDWAALKSSRGLSKHSSVTDVFTSSTVRTSYDSRNVPFRESRDSADSPRSTPIILGFDVTASMGYLAKELATDAVNRTVTSLLEHRPIPDPHILCGAIGDCRSDRAPLQVTQFEADIRIVRQLTELWLEGGGGGNGGESYNLLWYFASRHTKTDCHEKRGLKGFLFTVGDDNCHPGLTVGEIGRVFGDRAEYTLSNSELLREAMEKYEVFHIHIDNDNSLDRGVFARWQKLLPGRVTELHRKDIDCLSELITAIIFSVSGIGTNAILRSMDPLRAEKLARSLAFIEPPKKKGNSIIF